MPLEERITNLVSELKSDNIWPHFLQKKCRKLAKYPILPVFHSFFFGQEGRGQILSDFNSENIFGIHSSRRIFYTPKRKGLKTLFFIPPHCNFKTLVARGRVGIIFYSDETCQSVSRDTVHNKIIGTPRTMVSDTPY